MLRDEVETILKAVWYSGKNDSQVFDFFECVNRESWVSKILSLVKSASPSTGRMKLPKEGYPEDIFPTTIEQTGKLFRDKGLSEREITAVSGCIARLGWNNAIQQVKELNKELL